MAVMAFEMIQVITICKAIKFTIALVLFAISVQVSKDVFGQYSSKSTSFKQYEEEITEKESVTIVLGFWPPKKSNNQVSMPYQSYEQWKLGDDFTLAFGVINYPKSLEEINLQEISEYMIISHSSVGKVKFNKLVTKFGDYYKVTANVIKVKSPFWAYVRVRFNNIIPVEDIPNPDFYITSEDNSFGITMYNWQDGNKIAKENTKGSYFIEVKPKKIIKMKSQTKCSAHPYYDCLHSKLVEENYNHCSRKCFSISTYGNATPICKTVEEFQCAHEIASKVKEESNCLPSCTSIEYNVEFEYQENEFDNRHNITFAYKIANSKLKVEEEYLIQDFVGMLGSIGGTLGLFVGFSIFGGLSFILDHLQIFVEKFSKKKNDVQTSLNKERVVKVVPNVNINQMRPFDHDVLAKIESIESRLEQVNTDVKALKSDNKKQFQEMRKELGKITKVLGIVQKRKNYQMQ